MGSFGTMLMAHELAHQWFGDYITCASWHDIWINEGFATYCEGLVEERGLGTDTWHNWKNEMITEIVSRTTGSVWVDDTTSVDRIFSGRLSYKKGAMLLHQIRWLIGDEAFFAAIRNYLTDSKLTNSFAGTGDLQQHFEATSGQSLTEYMNDWYYGQGYPNYFIYWKQEPDGNLIVTVNQTPSHSSVEFFEMKLPFQIFGEQTDTLINLENTHDEQVFTIELDFRVLDIVFDPDLWIITKRPSVMLIDSMYDDRRITVSPNPTSDYLLIETNKEMFFNRITIIDTKGVEKLKMHSNIFSKRVTIDVSKLARGTYILALENLRGERASQLFIKN